MDSEYTYWLLNLRTGVQHGRGWKTYRGALRNAGEDDIVCSRESVDWIRRHPEYNQQRMAQRDLVRAGLPNNKQAKSCALP